MVFAKILGISVVKQSYFLYIFLFIVTVTFNSCYTLGTVEIEVIKPAKIILPQNVNSLLLVNNSLMYPAAEFKNDAQKGAFSLDTSSTQALIKTVGQIVNESPRFDTSIVLNDIYFRNSSNLLKPVSWQNVNKLCAENNTDALISLEAFGIKDTVVRLSYYDGFAYTSFANLVLTVNSMWRIYIPNNNSIIEKRIYRDTLFVENITSKSEYYYMLKEPEFVKQIANQISLSGAAKIADRLAPYWQPVERSFFIYGNDDMKKAAEYAYNDNWRAAAVIWKKLSENENIKLAGAACHNMALVCEVEGRLDLSEVWLKKSLENYDNLVSKEYYKHIKLRLVDADKLNKQFGID